MSELAKKLAIAGEAIREALRLIEEADRRAERHNRNRLIWQKGLKRQTGVPFGFARGNDGSLHRNESEQAAIARARELKGSGESPTGIGRMLAKEGHLSRTGKPFDASQVRRMLCRTADATMTPCPPAANHVAPKN